MPTLNIAGAIIDFPDDGASPDWAPAVILFAQAVASALNATIGPYDVPPQIQVIDAYNGSGTTINNLSFSTSVVRAAFIRYSVYRNTSTTTLAEAGTMIAVYNPNATAGSLWNLIRSYDGESETQFTMSDTGQVSFTNTAITGLNYNATISYSANALTQS